MSRSLFKGPNIDSSINLKEKKIKILKKNLIILPEYLNKTVYVYNGKQFIKLIIKDNMIGYKFGEFVNTRSNFKYKKK